MVIVAVSLCLDCGTGGRIFPTCLTLTDLNGDDILDIAVGREQTDESAVTTLTNLGAADALPRRLNYTGH